MGNLLTFYTAPPVPLTLLYIMPCRQQTVNILFMVFQNALYVLAIEHEKCNTTDALFVYNTHAVWYNNCYVSAEKAE